MTVMLEPGKDIGNGIDKLFEIGPRSTTPISKAHICRTLKSG
jgi:hypothetical protein